MMNWNLRGIKQCFVIDEKTNSCLVQLLRNKRSPGPPLLVSNAKHSYEQFIHKYLQYTVTPNFLPSVMIQYDSWIIYNLILRVQDKN